MGFGFLPGLSTIINAAFGIGFIKNKISHSNTTKALKEDSIRQYKEGKNPSGTYMDSHWRERDIFTNKIVYRGFNRAGDKIIEDEKGNIIRNITEQKRKDNFKEKVLEGEKYIFWQEWNNLYSGISDSNGGKVYGKIFKKADTGELVIEKNAWVTCDNLEYIPDCLIDPYRKKHDWYSIQYIRMYIGLNDGLIKDFINSKEPDFIVKDIQDRFFDFFNEEQQMGGWVRRSLERRGIKPEKGREKRDFYLENKYVNYDWDDIGRW